MFSSGSGKDLMDPSIASLLIALEGKMRRVRKEVRYQLETLATVPNTLPLQKILSSYSKLAAICGKIADGIGDWYTDIERYLILIKANDSIKTGVFSAESLKLLDPKGLVSPQLSTVLQKLSCKLLTDPSAENPAKYSSSFVIHVPRLMGKDCLTI